MNELGNSIVTDYRNESVNRSVPNYKNDPSERAYKFLHCSAVVD